MVHLLSPAPALQSILTCACPSPGAPRGTCGPQTIWANWCGDSPSVRSNHLLRHAVRSDLFAPYLLGRVVPNHPRPLRGRCRRRVSGCTHVRSSSMEPSTREAARWRHSSCHWSIPRLHHPGMHWVREEGFQGCGRSQLRRGTVHMPAVPPAELSPVNTNRGSEVREPADTVYRTWGVPGR